MAAAIPPQLEDARAAFALIRRRAAEWRVDPNRIGMVGFSAGAMLTLTTALAGQDAKPAFIGDIYGPVGAMTVPADAPPLFVALAADDPFFGGGEMGIVKSWIAAKRPVELHLFEQGGHGFGMYPKDDHQHGLVRCVRALARHARDAQAGPLRRAAPLDCARDDKQ